ncbi:hypothetical protein [Streptomyces candidus]|uniref:Phytoene/squalene synthetase n=1 Tax=Streptomyces candidus TaxID=67283 RepID=A0A7X0HKZ8_9ACTN|nr:hypothetical protein [Streptomyces candidus]MBB6439496.1 phytoene/squalene synthetase [Streptomyces candidus]
MWTPGAAGGAQELFPFEMAKFGLAVEDALALPEKQKAARKARKAAEQARQEAEAAAKGEHELGQQERAAAAEVRRMRIAATAEVRRSWRRPPRRRPKPPAPSGVSWRQGAGCEVRCCRGPTRCGG